MCYPSQFPFKKQLECNERPNIKCATGEVKDLTEHQRAPSQCGAFNTGNYICVDKQMMKNVTQQALLDACTPACLYLMHSQGKSESVAQLRPFISLAGFPLMGHE